MLELLIVAFLIVLNAFFAMSEMALMTSRKIKLKQMAEDSRGARVALALAEHPDNLLSTVQVGITLIGVLTGFFGGESIGLMIADRLGDVEWIRQYARTVGTAVAVVLITAAQVIFGELIPKRLALTNPEKIACNVAIPLNALARGARPVVAVLGAINRLVLRILGIKDDARGAITEEEIQLLVTESHEQGVIDADERNMMTRVMRLGDRTAESLMTPRMRIAWLDAAADREENMETMRETPYSRYPVYRGSDAEVIGVLEVKTLLDELGKTEPELFRDIRPAVFVSESTHALKLLEIFREEQQSIALVVDEYGDIQGMVTTSDVMGAILAACSRRKRPTSPMRWSPCAKTVRCSSTAHCRSKTCANCSAASPCPTSTKWTTTPPRAWRSRTSGAFPTSASSSTGKGGASKSWTSTARASTSCC